MKLPFILIVMCTVSVFLSSCSDKRPSGCVMDSQIDSSQKGLRDYDKYFMVTDFDKYIGGAVGELVDGFPARYTNLVGISEPPSYLVGIHYTFPDGYTISIKLTELKYTERYSQKRDWDLSQINKEKITGILVTHQGAADYYCEGFGEVGGI